MSIKEKSTDWIQPTFYLMFYQKLSSMYQEQKSIKRGEKNDHVYGEIDRVGLLGPTDFLFSLKSLKSYK